MLVLWARRVTPFLQFDNNWHPVSVWRHAYTERSSCWHSAPCCSVSSWFAPLAQSGAQTQTSNSIIRPHSRKITLHWLHQMLKTFYLKPTASRWGEIYVNWLFWSWDTHARTPMAEWWNMENSVHCSPRICAKGYRHERWSIDEFHNAVWSRSSLALSTEQLICSGPQFSLWTEELQSYTQATGSFFH